MLLAMLSESLFVASDQRSASQVRVVEMVEQTLTAVQADYQKMIEVEDGRVSTIEGAKAELARKADEAETVKGQSQQEAAAKKAAAAVAQEAKTSAAEPLNSALSIQKEGDASLNECEAMQQELQKALEEHLGALCDATTDAVVATLHREAILRVVGSLEFDQSLQMSLPGILAKQAGERGDFDLLVLEQLKKLLSDKIAAHAATLEAGAEGKAARADAVEKASKASEDATAALKNAKDEEIDADIAQQNAACAVDTAKAAIADNEKELKDAVLLQETGKATLELFRNHNLATFMKLRNKVSTDEAAVAGA